MAEQAPFTQKMQTTLPATAAGTTYDQAMGEVPFDAVVTGISYTPEANITGADTNTRTLTVVNKGQDGNGTTVLGTLAFVNGTNATDFNEIAFTLSAVANALNVATGDILAAVSTHSADGLADPGGLVQVELSRRYA